MGRKKFLIFIMIIPEWSLMLNTNQIHRGGLKLVTPKMLQRLRFT